MTYSNLRTGCWEDVEHRDVGPEKGGGGLSLCSRQWGRACLLVCLFRNFGISRYRDGSYLMV